MLAHLAVFLVLLFSMTVRAAKFTPEVMLSAPRRSSGVPNSDGSRILYSVSTYSFENHGKKSEIRVLDAKSNESKLVTDAAGASEPQWLNDEDVLLLLPGQTNSTDIAVGKADAFEATKAIAGNFDGSGTSIRVKKISDDKWTFAITGLAKPDGTPYSAGKAPKKLSSGKLYKQTFVRHWDSYIAPERNAIFVGTITKPSSSAESGKLSYALSPLRNVLAGTGLESPVPTFGGIDHYDIGEDHIIFVAKEPTLKAGFSTKVNVYVANLYGTLAASDLIYQVLVPGFGGATTSPVFSKDGKKAAFLMMQEDGYEADKNQLFVIPDVRRPNWLLHLLNSTNGKGSWPLSPGGVSFSNNGDDLYLVAEDRGRTSIFTTPVNQPAESSPPKKIYSDGNVSDLRVLADGNIFISGTNIVDNSFYSILFPNLGTAKLISSNTENGKLVSLSRSQVADVYFKGAERDVQAFLLKPSNFDSDKKYPLAFLVHGGPQGAWEDAWSSRWNMAVFAEAGYVVFAPNPTGSTGFGQDFTDAIQGQWGGLPYKDLVAGYQWIEENLDYVDLDKTVALGASYGGYMMNWIQGHELGRKFKAIVCHDGVFSMVSQLASEEQWFPTHDLEGFYWNNEEKWLRWDPARFTGNWSTPQLVIHSELDYRLTIAEGLAAFNVLQARGVESQFLTFPDENHWVQKEENSLMWHTAVLNWINKFVGYPPYKAEDEAPGTVINH
ncbi:hypothetical protein P152DRAFT_458438 [Eremomyces bilateralis CBS 781.70]|uniref:Dipeptidyl-peptidase V n=1 Tax=Eremomyces bilateralis CBS 781.70 TaxID=1392243 RepID=A0A6G1G3C8_9PEZI|nr:uncharacterized protein P152DRAFT_458438 [Eremomyces bilateralis CBS 781.70]KAF1812617.1 hypothetical protein P152DRAFT_458438 [Eremomyces bilateralis CBS 781.70]